MTNKEVAKRLREEADKLAKAIAQVIDIKETLEFLSSEMKDNGDPGFALSEAMAPLAKGLTSTMEYAMEYEEEALKDYKKEVSKAAQAAVKK